MAAASPPQLLSAVSRMTHGPAGDFDIELPLKGGSGVECRSTKDGLTIVMTFSQPLANTAKVTVTGGKATAGKPSFSTNVMTVKLTGVANASAVTLTTSGVANAAGEKAKSQTVTLRTLFGDINSDGRLTAADVNLVKAAANSRKPVTKANFRNDIDLDGRLNLNDANRGRTAVTAGGVVAGGATANTPPTITTIANQSVVTGTAMSPAGFTVGDAESDPATLTVAATSSDQATIPDAAITVSGVGASRAITLTPAVGVMTVIPVTITLTVFDGLDYSSPMSFVVNVTPPPITYLATLAPFAGTGSLGSGTAILTVSGDQTQAILSYTTTNLSSAESDETVNDGTGAVMYDVPVGRQLGQVQPDGSFKWVFSPTKAAAIVSALASNTSYFYVQTANFPAGELTGTFKPLNGSQIFTPPAPPPSIVISPPTPTDASRFLQQAAFGGTSAEIAALSNASAPNAATAITDWLAVQFAKPKPVYPNYAANVVPPTLPPLAPQSIMQPYTTSSMYWNVYNRVCTPQAPNAYADTLVDDRLNEAWWKTVVTAPDPLRHRIATALSEIFVVSEIDDQIGGNIPGLASYYDMLADGAFGNFRTLLGNMTLHPIMGDYLNMVGSTKTTPNENFAREIMQLFTIGLYRLQPDGTLMLDSAGRPIPTYDQSQVTSLAAVYTGWNFNANRPNVPTLIAPVAPATIPTISNFSSAYQQPMTLSPSSHSTVAKTLLTYPGAAVTSIPATTGTPDASVVEAELNTALDNLFNHPNVPPFISRLLIQRLVLSNPSPGYVYRVAQKFVDNGQGVRGDMKAVITAILTDYEARSPDIRNNPGYGKAREPIIRVANLMHSFGAKSKSGKWAMAKTDTALAQTLFRAPTVFNFFDPSYADPGGIQQAGLVSPEFAIIYETTITNAQNQLYTAVYAAYNTDGSPKMTGNGFNGDIYFDHSASGSGLVTLDTASGSAAMVDQVILLVNGGPLDGTGAARNRILQYVNTLSATDHIGRVQAALHLVATSAQAAIQK